MEDVHHQVFRWCNAQARSPSTLNQKDAQNARTRDKTSLSGVVQLSCVVTAAGSWPETAMGRSLSTVDKQRVARSSPGRNERREVGKNRYYPGSELAQTEEPLPERYI